ncbi:MAG TPA: acylphosphatase [Armatimonadota bacterium]|jgi:acylphosphatase
MAVKRITATVHGYVQGVGFRYYTQEIARELGLTGWVRNNWDETVEVVAEGEEGLLAKFIGMLKQGPNRAEVESIDVRREDPTGEFDRFYVKH